MHDTMQISWEEFSKIDLRVGTILTAEAFPDARKPAYKLTIDFGELGVKRSSAQITGLYEREMLIGMQVVAVVNLPVKQIANFFSECLVLGAYLPDRHVVLLGLGQRVRNGSQIG